MQTWLIQRIIREILPFVIDGVRAQVRNRERAARAEAVDYGETEPMRAAPLDEVAVAQFLRRELDERLRAAAEENETRFAAVQSQLRALEDRVLKAHAEQTRSLEKALLYTRVLLGWSAALTVAVLYALLR